MGRHHATSWLVALLVVAFGTMGFLRDVHAASHEAESVVAACETTLQNGTTPCLPVDSSPEPDNGCDTCDLIAVKAKSIDAPSPAGPVFRDETGSRLCLTTPSAPVVVSSPRDSRPRGPPAVSVRTV